MPVSVEIANPAGSDAILAIHRVGMKTAARKPQLVEDWLLVFAYRRYLFHILKLWWQMLPDLARFNNISG